MTTPINYGGPAFPTFPTDRGFAEPVVVTSGMTLRDYFAAAALTGLCSNRGTTMVYGAGQTDCVNMANACYAYADAMIDARLPKP